MVYRFCPAQRPSLVQQSLLTTLGLSEQAGQSTLDTVSRFLRPRRALLILDNCEHLIQACAQLVETQLRSCPTLHILATSRETLGVAGETPYLVPTLTTPDLAKADLETLPQYEAVQLFVERAQTAMPGFKLTNENMLAIAQVCHQLDGIPLALELAAARVKALRVEQIAARLAERDQFRLLTGGSRTDLPRHQTLHALIDWSHDLLSEPERVLLRRLAVFAGGWTLEAAEGVCVGDGVETDAVLDLMTQLVNKSLILAMREQGQEARYRMLETIRQYASERLLEADEGGQLRKRHLNFFLEWTEQVKPKLRGPQQLEWLDRLELEHDNLRTALEWSLTQVEHGEASLRLAGALHRFWSQRGHVSEGRAWLDRALTNPNSSTTGVAKADALHAAGDLAREQGDMTWARTLLEESAGLWQALGSSGKTGLAYTLATWAEMMRRQGDPTTARSLADEAVALCREQDDRWGLAYSLSILGIAIRDQEDFALARSLINESVALWQGLGDQWGFRFATWHLGMVALRQGDYEVAQRHYSDCLAIARKFGNEEAVAEALVNLGVATLNMGDRVQAKSLFAESVSLFRDSGSKSRLAESFYYFGFLALFDGDHQQAKSYFEQELALARTVGPIWLGAQGLRGLAGVATTGGQVLRGARLLGAAEARAEAAATYNDAVNSQLIGRTIVTAVAQLGEAAFEQARAEGRAMTFEQAVEYALETEPSS